MEFSSNTLGILLGIPTVMCLEAHSCLGKLLLGLHFEKNQVQLQHL